MDGYNTVNQKAYWGSYDGANDVAALTDIGPVISGVDVPSEVAYVQRSVLGNVYPTVSTALVSYRFAFPRMRVGVESEAMRTSPQRNLAVVRTDDKRAYVCINGIVSGIPMQAASNGEITSGVSVRPTTVVVHGHAIEMDGTANRAISNSGYLYAVVTAGNGDITAGLASTTTNGPGIYLVTPRSAVAAAVVDASLRGWLLHGLEIASGA